MGRDYRLATVDNVCAGVYLNGGAEAHARVVVDTVVQHRGPCGGDHRLGAGAQPSADLEDHRRVIAGTSGFAGIAVDMGVEHPVTERR